jgi:hypothetical protein
MCVLFDVPFREVFDDRNLGSSVLNEYGTELGINLLVHDNLR